MDAIGADERIRREVACRRVHQHPVSGFGKAVQLRTRANGIGAEAISQRRQQQHLQLAAVHRILRIAVATVDSTWLTEQQLAVGVVVRDRGGRDGDLRQLVAQSELIELADGVWQQVDADAQRPQVRGAFENGRIDAAGVQCQCGGQPADPATGNQ